MQRSVSLARLLGGALIWSAAAASAWAQGGAAPRVWEPATLGMACVSTLVFGLIGIVLAIAGYKLFDALTPFHLEREICEKQNLPVALLCSAMVLGICLIVAAAVL
jgi:uncharacterized membrane protein YjfL (UPF0719 family)